MIMHRFFAAILAILCSATSFAQPATRPTLTSIAFYYGADVPWESLGAFDVAVVEPGNVKPLPTGPGWSHRLNPGTQVAAYISVGEVHPTRPYFSRMRPEWKLGENAAWQSIVVDQAAHGYAAFYLREVIEPLWQAGYRAFFLDTLDSFYLVAKTPEAQAKQIEGMAQLIREIKRAYPQARLLFNRGFEILPQVHRLVDSVVAESLFKGYNAEKKQYTDVPQTDRDWLWGQLKKCRDEYGLPVISIDYVPPDQREQARETARKIGALGAIAWVTNPEINMMGVGSVEVLPRQILAIHDEPGHEAMLSSHSVHRLATLPLHALGLDVRYVFFGSEEMTQLLSSPWAGRFAGVLVWQNAGTAPDAKRLAAVSSMARNQGVPLVFFSEIRNDAIFAALGIQHGPPERSNAPLRLEKLSPHIGVEVEPSPLTGISHPFVANEGTVWLRAHSPSGRSADVISIMPWGGYVHISYAWISLGHEMGERWIVDPIEFFRAALKRDGNIPQPDITTQTGKRMLLVHHDGDGFANRAEMPGAPFASEVMLSEFLQRYRIPTLVSVIEGETGAKGLYPALSPALEPIAKRMFALPHVEIATHSFSHPFYWAEMERGETKGDRPTSLKIPNYQFDIKREIAGSADYINQRLAPPNKRTRMMLWTGDTQPLAAPVREAYAAGLLNMNAGDTWITRAKPSLTLVSPIGMMKGEYFQIYAPNQNENVYTNDWTGPFYGFDRVIETFEMTELPRRLKPINIYYHTYIASKRASIQSLHKIFQWALAQDVHPVHVTEYAERVLDWRRATVSRDMATQALQLRSGSHLRQWRVADRSGISAASCTGVAGHALHAGLRYLNAINSIAKCADGASGNPAISSKKPELESANAKLEQWHAVGDEWRGVLQGHVPFKARIRSDCPFDAARSSPGLRAQQVAGGYSIEALATPDVQRIPGGQTQLVFRCARS
jgi:polysaccharide biosynthesis protein PelA